MMGSVWVQRIPPPCSLPHSQRRRVRPEERPVLLCRIHLWGQAAAQLNLQSWYQSRGCQQRAWAALPWLLWEELTYFKCSLLRFFCF